MSRVQEQKVPAMSQIVPKVLSDVLEQFVPKKRKVDGQEQIVPKVLVYFWNNLFRKNCGLEQKVPINIYAELFVPLNR